MRIPLFLGTLILFFNVSAQEFTVNGYLRDQETGEALIGGTVSQLRKAVGTTANNHGFYSLTLSSDSVALVYSYVGYDQQVIKFFLRRDTMIHVLLKSSNLLDEVTVSATPVESIHEGTQMSTINIPILQMKALPGLLGEADVFKVLQLMPGVQSGTEGSAGLYVRGGGPDQNLILLDGVPVYNASHLFGFFSVFNADALNHIELIKGGFPARYGGRLSSVIDISMKEGDMKKLKGEASIGLIASKFTYEGPLKKDKTSFLISSRRTYIDALSKPFKDYIPKYHFYDLNVKLNHMINNNHRIFLSTYSGLDKWSYIDKYSYSQSTPDGEISGSNDNENGLNWRNSIMAARWSYIITPKLFGNLTATYSRYHFQVFSSYDRTNYLNDNVVLREYNEMRYSSGIRDWAAKIDFDLLPNPNHNVRFGVSMIDHRFSPGVYFTRATEVPDTTVGAQIKYAKEFALYAEDDWKISSSLKGNIGLHASAFLVDGQLYRSIQPRISSRYLLGESLSLKTSFSTMTQFVHLLSNAGLGLPTDLWVPSTARVKPQQAWQAAIGLAKTYKNVYEISLEAYYKKMTSLIDYKPGATFTDVATDWQEKVALDGKGWSRGLELLLQKKTGHTTGWIGYTLSWTDRQFDEINFGKRFPFKYDNRHDVNVAVTHNVNKRMDFSLVWVLTTGNATTLPTAIYPGNPYKVIYYEGRNSYRMRDYHRLDLSYSIWKNRKWGQTKWTFGVYNAYNRQNPFYMEIGDNNKGHKKVYQHSLFPIILSISYGIKF